MKFVVEITCDNHAFFEGETFAPAQEVARLIRQLSHRLSDGGAHDGTLLDVNGNRVGNYRFTD